MAPRHYAGSPADIVALIAAGRATSRSELARVLELAPSTISLRVQELLDTGLIVEKGAGRSTGGRRARTLALAVKGVHVITADLGEHHARLAIADVTGTLITTTDVELDITTGPEAVLKAVVDHGLELALSGNLRVRGLAFALPGPVDVGNGTVTSPSRMPGWRGFAAKQWLVENYGLPAIVENDANAMAYGEHITQGAGLLDTITVKAGNAIGSGAIINGRIHHGATNASGDITHVRVPAAGKTPCSCGNHGCLETVASGAALARSLATAGLAVGGTADIVRLALQGEPLITTAVRAAGSRLGEVLCAVVNFVNPAAVYLAGSLSTVQPFVAAVRSQLYEGCHPLANERLKIARAITGPDAGVIGMTRLILEELMTGSLTTTTT